MLRQLLTAFPFFLVALACDADECQEGDFKCEDDAAWKCVQTPTPTGGKLAWDGRACAEGLCRTADEQSFCTLSADPIPECEAGSHCDGTTRIECISGYLVRKVSCAICGGTSTHCEGRLGSSCTTSTECADDLVCESGKCGQSCSCPDNVICEECATESVSANWVPICRAGWCGAELRPL